MTRDLIRILKHDEAHFFKKRYLDDTGIKYLLHKSNLRKIKLFKKLEKQCTEVTRHNFYSTFLNLKRLQLCGKISQHNFAYYDYILTINFYKL